MKKVLYTLNIGNYEPEVTHLSYPLFQRYADKIGADFYIINERAFPGFPLLYEKLQIYRLSQELGADWNIYLDSDALIHPDMFDMTAHLPMDTVANWGRDIATTRFRTDRFFARDGRQIGCGNWLVVGSSWCVELWEPLCDLTLQQALDNIFPTVRELDMGLKPDHLIEDYILSRNVAKYGLKHITVKKLMANCGIELSNYFWHFYGVPVREKITRMKGVLEGWGLRSGDVGSTTSLIGDRNEQE